MHIHVLKDKIIVIKLYIYLLCVQYVHVLVRLPISLETETQSPKNVSNTTQG